ncbi:hypothetical protein IQ07DRAFT_661792 [Pyrenochaeta sp. DS3sAY3a]|nr:hypothetical protein IQ07DRAFT_661792 [Pyrenochaeta sp. DS3sAY3a]
MAAVRCDNYEHIDDSSSEQYLAAISLLSALDSDTRPAFAFQAYAETNHDAPLQILYYNPALVAVDGLLIKVSGRQEAASMFTGAADTQLAFKAWLLGSALEGDVACKGNAYQFEGHLWTALVVDGHKIVSGIPTLLLWVEAVPTRQRAAFNHTRGESFGRDPPPQATTPASSSALPSPTFPPSSEASCPSLYSTALQHGPFDYTLEQISPLAFVDDHITYFRNVNWAQTPMGPLASWSPELRCVVNLVLNSSYPSVMFWGKEVIMIYNFQYTQLLGKLHPCVGKSIRTEAAEHWPAFEPLFNHMNKTGQSLSENDMPLFVDRHGFPEEAHWTFQIVPVLDHTGHVAGYHQTLMETTDHHLLKRRVSSLVELASQTAKARDFDSFWTIALRTLTLNDKDVPFALLYAVERHALADISSVSSPRSTPPLESCVLKGAIGVDAGHPIAPSIITIHDGAHIFQPFLLQAATSRKATVVHLDKLNTEAATWEGIDWKGYGDPCRTIVICPILLTTAEHVEGFVVLGLNPRRPFDEDYQQFVQVMLRLLTTSLASVVLFDEEVRQREIAIGQAASIQKHLLAQLQSKENKFTRFAERSDVAIFIMDPVGKYTYRNQRWFDLFDIATEDDDVKKAWAKIVFPDDIKYCEGLFTRLAVEKETICFELRTRMLWIPPAELVQTDSEATTNFKWILCSAYPELDASGELVEIVGNVTDISKQKWAESIQKGRTESALESKQHLEHFIDTTSHEMRNPLSAILQCADGILSSYSPGTEKLSPMHKQWQNFLEQTLDAAQTIAQCAQHMRHIVDDILTISKLDSGLLVITPIDSQPVSVVRHAVEMFEAEANASGLDLSFTVDETFTALGIDWVSLDPTRLLQILINLITNSIKFTRMEPNRHVTVTLAASTVEPKSTPDGVQFIEGRLVDQDSRLQDDWKQNPELVFLQFSVTDTGRGLSEEESRSLFTRFSQASPRTHIHYGGSGLGLFISRRLTELQGGSIGLVSKRKEGSTFSFYIKARRTKPALLRKGSLPTIFPEDIRHRPNTPLINLPRLPKAPSYKVGIARKDNADRFHAPIQNPDGESSPSAFEQNLHPESNSRFVSLPKQAETSESKQEEMAEETLHVLVVEDNLVNQRVLAKQLRNLGCVVSVANHGREALDILPKTTRWNFDDTPLYCTQRSPSPITSTETTQLHREIPQPLELHLVLMDWEMPVMNGLTAVAQIRQFEKIGLMRGRVPVIGVTANVRQQQIETAMAAGMDDVVSKPFRVAELLGRMMSLVAKMARERQEGGAGQPGDDE